MWHRSREHSLVLFLTINQLLYKPSQNAKGKLCYIYEQQICKRKSVIKDFAPFENFWIHMLIYFLNHKSSNWCNFFSQKLTLSEPINPQIGPGLFQEPAIIKVVQFLLTDPFWSGRSFRLFPGKCCLLYDFLSHWFFFKSHLFCLLFYIHMYYVVFAWVH